MPIDRVAAGELAIQALEKLLSADFLTDHVYDVREREGQGWEGPLVKLWSEGCALADQALQVAGSRIPLPTTSTGTRTFGKLPSYYVMEG